MQPPPLLPAWSSQLFSFSPQAESSWSASSAAQTFLLLDGQAVHSQQETSCRLTVVTPLMKTPESCYLLLLASSKGQQLRTPTLCPRKVFLSVAGRGTPGATHCFALTRIAEPPYLALAGDQFQQRPQLVRREPHLLVNFFAKICSSWKFCLSSRSTDLFYSCSHRIPIMDPERFNCLCLPAEDLTIEPCKVWREIPNTGGRQAAAAQNLSPGTAKPLSVPS
jgi:hypothetical protein